MEKIKLGLIPAHRGLMDFQFSTSRKNKLIAAFKKINGIEVVFPSEDLVSGGIVKCEDDAVVVIDEYRKHKFDGIILAVLGYGDEKSALSIVEEYMDLPLLMYAMHEPIPDGGFFEGASLCGALPIAFGLRRRHKKITWGGIINPGDEQFFKSMESFKKVCNAVKSFRKARIGMLGLHPGDFELCAVNEGIMIEKYGQKILPFSTLRLKNDMEKVEDMDEINKIISRLKNEHETDYDISVLERLARLEIVILSYIKANRLNAFVSQSWTDLQKYIGVSTESLDGQLTRLGIPSASEGDLVGSLCMLIQQELSFRTKAPMFTDIMMVHPEIENRILAWHCGNSSPDLAIHREDVILSSHVGMEGDFGHINAAGASEFQMKPGPVTVIRLLDHHGVFKMICFNGEFVETEDKMRGNWAWIEVSDRNKLVKNMIEQGCTHHVSLIHGDMMFELQEFCKYMDIEFIQGI